VLREREGRSCGMDRSIICAMLTLSCCGMLLDVGRAAECSAGMHMRMLWCHVNLLEISAGHR
jgi:hypothetical protein